MFARYTAALLMFLVATAASAAELGAATFSDQHVRPSSTSLSVGYFTVTAPKNDAITKLTSDCCAAVELHRTEKLNGIMSMRRIAEMNLKKATPLKVQPDSPGGEHVMLMGLKAPLAEGDRVSITFTFKNAGEQTVSFPVYADGKGSAQHAH